MLISVSPTIILRGISLNCIQNIQFAICISHHLPPFFLIKINIFILKLYYAAIGKKRPSMSTLKFTFNFIHCLFPLSSADPDCIQKKLLTLSWRLINIKKCPMIQHRISSIAGLAIAKKLRQLQLDELIFYTYQFFNN